MARKRKDKTLSKGPFTARDVEKALKLDGWTSSPGGNHVVWEHPTKPGKIPIKKSWTGLRAWCPILKGFTRTMGLTKNELLRLLNGHDPKS